MFSLLVVLLLIHILSATNCVFTDSSGTTTNALHLEWFLYNNKRLNYDDSSLNYAYYYTPCTNNAICDSDNDETMGQIKQSRLSARTCFIISKWDNNAVQPQYDNNTKTWTFYYDTGSNEGCIGNRKIHINWHCDMSQFGSITSMEETYQASCEYIMDIHSKWACLGQIPSDIDDDNWWNVANILIVTVSALVICGILALVLRVWIMKKYCNKDAMNDINNDYGARNNENRDDHTDVATGGIVFNDGVSENVGSGLMSTLLGK